MATEAQFLGTGWSFPPAFDWRSKEAVLVSADEDVAQSLYILLSTAPGERVMQPEYGCDLQRLVFETLNDSTLTEIRDIVTKAVLFFEVRITLHDIAFDTSGLLDGVLRLRLDYTLRSTNTRSNLVYPFYRDEGTRVRQRA